MDALSIHSVLKEKEISQKVNIAYSLQICLAEHMLPLQLEITVTVFRIPVSEN